MPRYAQEEYTFRFPNVNGRYVGHVVNWDEHSAEEVHLSIDGEDFFGVITRSYSDYVAVSLGPIVFCRNGEGRRLTAGEHLVGAEIDGVGGYVREARSIEHLNFDITSDSTPYQFSSTGTQTGWGIATRRFVGFTGDGDEHIATLDTTHGIVIAHDGLYNFHAQFSFDLNVTFKNKITSLISIDNADGHVQSLLLESTTLPSTNLQWEISQTGTTAPIRFRAGDRASLLFQWRPASGITGGRTRTATMSLVDDLGIEVFLAVDRWNLLDGSHGSVITDFGTDYTPGVAPEALVEVHLW